MDQLEMKKLAARAALKYVKPDTIVGVGSGSTVNCFIEALGELKDQIQGAVAASKASEELLRKQGIEVFSANDVSSLDIYVDGADEINPQKMMISRTRISPRKKLKIQNLLLLTRKTTI